MDLKMQLQQKLVANVIMDRCLQNRNVIFNPAFCSGDRVVRFTTPFLKEISGDDSGQPHVVYEVYPTSDSFTAACVMARDCISSLDNDICKKLLSISVNSSEVEQNVIIREWGEPVQLSLKTVSDVFDDFLNSDIIGFEIDIRNLLCQKEHDQYVEGGKEKYLTTRYERNPKARARCLAYHGTACAICGIDFKKTYGEAFEGKIEVHHIVPVSHIGEEYVVDPIRDLVPLCPNCHTAVHSKTDGVYTVEEMKIIMSKSH